MKPIGKYIKMYIDLLLLPRTLVNILGSNLSILNIWLYRSFLIIYLLIIIISQNFLFINIYWILIIESTLNIYELAFYCWILKNDCLKFEILMYMAKIMIFTRDSFEMYI